ncbi:hypothetical protein J2Z42_000557 [Clostridium algifaecis]|uniref:Aspartyl-phosphate phosphatase Spo0E family protein n=1 Tax=Clostridium algifaecis TaxID=1472040 RepID=A0ABS4KPB9_9CLOT|nr:aspartyl-phosphate phosphatase Spo0E family protein [Clostridium algifaecis]MBP2031892.1 hypothetical protein [Clostridium algifaecis]
MNETIEELRDKLNKMLDSNEYTREEILKTSVQLDKLIVFYYKSPKNKV